MKVKITIISVFLVAMLSVGLLIQAQETTPEPSGESNIEFTGELVIIDSNTVQIAGLTVIITDAEIEGGLVDGVIVAIEGILLSDGTIIALEIEVEDDSSPEITPEATAEVTPEVTPEVTAEPTPEIGEGDVIIVIEGPVEAVNVNIITIYNISIEVEEDDPALTVIQIGDILRIEGVLHDEDDDDDDEPVEEDDNIIFLNIIVINITFINVEVYINDDGQVWRDPLTCLIAPPPWASADAWYIRCTTSSPNNGGGGNGSGGGSGSGRSGGSS